MNRCWIWLSSCWNSVDYEDCRKIGCHSTKDMGWRGSSKLASLTAETLSGFEPGREEDHRHGSA